MREDKVAPSIITKEKQKEISSNNYNNFFF